MENIGYYLSWSKKLIKEGWEFLFNDPQKIEAHHLIAFILTVIILNLLSYIVSKVFKTAMRLCIIISSFSLLWMLLFDRSKYNELFNSNNYKKSENEDANS